MNIANDRELFEIYIETYPKVPYKTHLICKNLWTGFFENSIVKINRSESQMFLIFSPETHASNWNSLHFDYDLSSHTIPPHRTISPIVKHENTREIIIPLNRKLNKFFASLRIFYDPARWCLFHIMWKQ